MAQKHEQKNQVNIQIVTGSGNYPKSGYRHFNVHEKLEFMSRAFCFVATTWRRLVESNTYITESGDFFLQPVHLVQ